MVLASTPDLTALDKLAEMADKIIVVASLSIAYVDTLTTAAADQPPTLAAEVEHLRDEVSSLEKLVQKFAHPRSSSQSIRRSSLRSPTPTSSTTPADSLCWYHHKFGDEAQRCRSPCEWSSNEQASPATLTLVASLSV